MDESGRPRGSSSSRRHAESLLDYKLVRTLGVGSFGKVKLAEHLITGCKVAIKILNRKVFGETIDPEEKVRREIKILRLFMHPHVIRLYEAIETDSDIYVVMEYINNGELFDYLVGKTRLHEDEARRFFQQIISGVEYCHKNMVVHRDLKPENLLLDAQNNIKIADFGLSNVMCNGHFLKTSCGSPNYAAPEVISGRLYAGPEVDVWSCGVILYVLLCGTLPFDDDNITNLFRKIKDGIYTLPRHLSAGARDLISRMLLVDPLKRATISEIKNHSWFVSRIQLYLAVPPLDTARQVRRVDEDAIFEVVRLGIDRHHLLEALQNRVQNKATVTYFLILDNWRQFSTGYLGGNFHDTVLDASSDARAFNQRGPPLMASTRVHENGGSSNRQPAFQPERKWALGLKSWTHPREIMHEVLTALQSLAVSWKKIGQYNMKCRWLPPFSTRIQEHFTAETMSCASKDPNTSQKPVETKRTKRPKEAIKFELQLYKTKENKYLLDLQRIQGCHLLFLDLCACFFSELRVL